MFIILIKKACEATVSIIISYFYKKYLYFCIN